MSHVEGLCDSIGWGWKYDIDIALYTLFWEEREKKERKPALAMEEALPRPASGRTKHVLAEEAQLDAFPNHRVHYTLLGFLQKRRGGGGASRSSGSLSAGGDSGGQ